MLSMAVPSRAYQHTNLTIELEHMIKVIIQSS
jgi:hypothetical protein